MSGITQTFGQILSEVTNGNYGWLLAYAFGAMSASAGVLWIFKQNILCRACAFFVCQKNVDIKENPETTIRIPSPDYIPALEPVPFGSFNSVVVFDTETTGFGDVAELCQLAAAVEHLSPTGESVIETFNAYFLPKTNISPYASRVNGLTVLGNTLFYNENPVKTTELKTGLQDFLTFLQRFEGPVLLAAHNSKAFDSKVLLKDIMQCHLEQQFASIVVGITDTRYIFKDMFPDLKSHSMKALVTNFLGEFDFEAHNAVEDCKVLLKLIQLRQPSQELMVKHSTSVTSLVARLSCSRIVQAALKSFQELVDKNIIAKEIARKIANTGLELGHLHFVWTRSKQDGIKKFLSERKVTINQNSICKISEYFETL